MAIGKKHGGRQKGTANKATSELVAMLKEDAKAHGEEGWHPVVYLQRIAMGVEEPASELSDRISCAKAVAEYVAAKRRAVDDAGDSREHVIHHIAASDAGL